MVDESYISAKAEYNNNDECSFPNIIKKKDSTIFNSEIDGKLRYFDTKTGKRQ